MTGAGRRRWQRWSGLAASITAAVVLGATGPAGATLAQGWAWQEQRAAIPGLGAASGIPSGDLAVAWFGQPDKLTYLATGLQNGAGSLVGAVLELSVDPSAPNLRPDTAQLRACAVVGTWEPGAPMAWDTRPATVCDAAPDGSYDAATGAFHFDLTPLAAAVGAADTTGVSIEPANQPSAPFQVVFKGADAVALRRPEAATPPPVETSGPDAPVPAAAEAAGVAATAPAPSPPIPASEAAPAVIPDSGPTSNYEPSPAVPFPAAGEEGAAPPVPASPLVGEVAVAPASSAPVSSTGHFGLEAVYAMLVALAALPLVSRLLVAFRRGGGPR